MNRLRIVRLTIEYGPGGGGGAAPLDVAAPIVDDVPLYESLHAHPGVDVHLVAPPSRHWLGEPAYGEPSHAPDEYAAVLDGSCGFVDCCGVSVRIEVTPSTVVWSDFIWGLGRPAVPEGLRFEFPRDEYEGEIAALGRLTPVVWTLYEPDEDV